MSTPTAKPSSPRHRASRVGASPACAQAAPTDENAAEEIDRVLTAALIERRPAYLRIRSDVAAATIRPACSPLSYTAPTPSHADALVRFASAAQRRLDAAHSAAVLVDFLADRYGVAAKVRELVTGGPLPYATLSMGKGVLDETAVGALGVCSGAFSAPHVRQTIDGADLLIQVGVQLADTTSGGFTHGFAEDKGIEIRPTEVLVDGEVFPGIPMGEARAELTSLVQEKKFPALDLAPGEPQGRPVESLDAPLTQDVLWDTIAGWLNGHQTLVTEQGTSFFGIATRRLPNGTRFIGQPLWGSIGYSLPALLGAQLADPTRRGVLLIGDDSAQMTIQELGTIARQGHPGHPPDQQRRIHRGTRHPRRPPGIQRHRLLELVGRPHRAGST